MSAYAHSLKGRPESDWQTLDKHHKGVAGLASAFASAWAPRTAALLGLIHDMGKNSDEFQARLRGRGLKVDHTSAAYLYLHEIWNGQNDRDGEMLARLLAYPLLGHHGGMLNYGSEAEDGTLAWRLYGDRIKAVPDWKSAKAGPLPAVDKYFTEIMPFICVTGKKPDPFAAAFFLRMLYSCLVDADFLDTEQFCAPERYGLRPQWSALEKLEYVFFKYLETKGFLRKETVEENALAQGKAAPCGSSGRREAIRKARSFMLQQCMKAGEEYEPGFFSLTMPTGGGKTLSSVAFALRHARKYGLERIIMVVPYTSIIEQNADVLREALGEEAVLEHHSNYVPPEAADPKGNDEGEMIYRLSTENWEATVIVTTSVQFFESLFDNRPSRCRKLHNIARSVIIFDEAQMLPVPFVKPCLAALKELVRSYGSTVVLCTATQPALMQATFLKIGLNPEAVRDIIPESAIQDLFAIFERAQVEVWPEPLDDDRLAQIIMDEPQVLCIVNSRKHAGELFALMEGGEADFHLSARMTPEHRTRVLAKVRARLAAGQPCRVVSTSLVECGVDISFPVVMREKNGLDVLAQAAGRCNREGLLASGRVICFSSSRPVPERAAELNRRRAAFDQVAQEEDLFCPAVVRRYFEKLYSASELDEEGILRMMEIGASPLSLWKFQFARMAQQFRFIKDDTVGIVIERGEAADLLKQAEAAGAPSSTVLRKLQRHTVQVYRDELECMRRQGRIETRCRFLNVLAGGTGYDDKTGLDVTLQEGIPVKDLLF